LEHLSPILFLQLYWNLPLNKVEAQEAQILRVLKHQVALQAPIAVSSVHLNLFTLQGLTKRKENNLNSPIQSWSPTDQGKNMQRNTASPQSSDNAVITSGSSGTPQIFRIQSPNVGSQVVTDIHDTYLDADYEDEVGGSPEPPAKKVRL
jgi:hypothetical protein